jgi:hypothetical protein
VYKYCWWYIQVKQTVNPLALFSKTETETKDEAQTTPNHCIIILRILSPTKPNKIKERTDMTIDADEAKRLIDILNKASSSDTSGATSASTANLSHHVALLDNDDVAAVIKILKDPYHREMQQGLEESEISRFKQIALAALRYALALSSPNSNLTLLDEANHMALAKRIIIDCLLPLTSMPTWIEAFILASMEILIENVVYGKGSSFGPVSTLGIESLLGPYCSRLHPDEAQELVQKLCCFHNNGQESLRQEGHTMMLNPYSAAAIVAALHETHQQLSLLTPQLVRNLISSILVSLRTLYKLEEYDSIPPLIYQLCGLTKLSFGTASTTTIKKATPFITSSSSKELELSYEILYGIAQLLSEFDCEKEQIRWTIGTSLSHLARILRNNSSLPDVLLRIIKGKKAHIMAKYKDNETVEQQRFRRLTPMMLAMGLTAASTIPRIKVDLLEAVRDLVVEEELMRWKRCHSRWVNCTLALICSKGGNIDETGDCDENGIDKEEMLRDLKRFQQQNEAFVEKTLFDDSHTLKCMNRVLELVCSSADERISETEFSSLLPILISLGFMLIDSVKKDTLLDETSSISAVTLPIIPSCASEVAQNGMQNIMKKANSSVAKIGRHLLVNIFIQSASNSDNDEITVIDSGVSRSCILSPQCRMILQTACEKFCGMAPNALEHSYLLREIMFYQNQSNDDDDGNLRYDTRFGKGAHILEECYIPSIIDVLANIPGGGMPPLVATVSVIPVLGRLLKLSRQKGTRSRRKRLELNDHIDHCFLLAKKALFCTDIDRRKVAVNLLVMLCRFAAEGGGNETALLDEVKGYLRRCMTQHQSQVRLEAYRSLVAIVPDSVDEDTVTGQQDTNVIANNDNIREVVSQILLDQLERYTVLEEDPSVIQARRNRAIFHGTHLSQQADIDSVVEENNDDAPLCLEKCISTYKHVSLQGNFLGVKRKKYKTTKLDLLEQALYSVSEPISFLLGACAATINGNVPERIPGSAIANLSGALIRLKTKVSSTDVSNYLKTCTRSSNFSCTQEQFVQMLSTCLIVASVAETLMSVPISNDMAAGCLLNLFRLRCEAISYASAIIVSDKLEQGKKRTKKRKTEKSEEIPNELEAEEKDIAVMIKEAKNDSNQKAMLRAEVAVKTALSSLSPSLPPLLLNESLRQYGILGQTDFGRDLLYKTQLMDDEKSPQTQLICNEPFRKFLIEQCIHLIAGEKVLLKAGYRFDVDVTLQGAECLTKYAPPVFMLAPTLFCEFLSHVQNKHAPSGDQVRPALSYLAFDGFKLCLQRLVTMNTTKTNLRQSIVRFFKSSISVASTHFSHFKEHWNKLEICGDIVQHIVKDEKEIFDVISPFVRPIVVLKEQNSKATCGLLSELLCRGLDAESSICCEVMKLILPYLPPDLRQILCLYFLESFQIPDSVNVTGLIGTDVENAIVDCQAAASSSIDAAIYADGLMDGSVEIPILRQLDEGQCRKEFELNFMKPRYLELVTGRSSGQSEFHTLDGDHLSGIVQLISSSFQVTNKVGSNFEALVGNATSLFHFVCTDIVAARDASVDLVSKYLSSASNSILAAIDNGLCDVEFVTTKVLPHMLGNRLVLLQRSLVNLLYSLAKVACTTCLCSEYFDDSGHFMSSLLKSCTRLYASYTKLLGYLSQYPKSLANAENKKFLLLKKNKLHDRVMALLLTLSEKLKVGNKELADSKISSHGRIAEQVVFEIERCDNAIINLGTKLKASGHEHESKFLLEMVSTGASVRGFRIDSEEIKEARQRVQRESEPKKKKSKTAPSTTTSKQSKTSRKGKNTKSRKKEKKDRTMEEYDSEADNDDDENDDDPSDDDNSQQRSENASAIGFENHGHHSSDDNENNDAHDRSDDDDGGDSIIGCFVVNSDSDQSEEEEEASGEDTDYD